MVKRVFLDMDPGIDDAAAIMMLSAFAEWEIMGISTVSGNVEVEKTAANAMKIVEALELNVEVFKGASRPLVKRAHHAYRVHGKDGLGDIDLEFHTKSLSNKYGPIAMIESAKENKDLWLLATGPLTNVSIATILEPDFPKMLKGLVVMGGAFNLSKYGVGNITRFAEFNMWFDPEAAKIVSRSFDNVTFIGLDVTANPKVWISKNEIDNLKEAKRSSILRSIVKKYIKSYGSFVPHDPIAAYYLINPESFQIEEHCIKVKTGRFRGMTALDNYSEDCKKSRIATDVNTDMFKNTFLKSMEF